MRAGLLIALLAAGCGPSVSQIQTQYVARAERCIADAKSLYAQCPSGQACIGRLDALEAQCNRDFDAICGQSRRARRLCDAAR